MLTGSDGTTYEPLHFTFFFALSCKVTLARCHRHLLVSKAPKPSSIKIGVGGLDARLHQMAGEGARRRTDLEPIVSKLTFTGSTEAGKLPMEQRVGTVKKLSLEHAQEMAAHESPRTTKLYDRTKERLTQDEVERIRL